LVPEEKHGFANLTFSDFFMKFFGEKFGQIFFWSKNENKEKKINQNIFPSFNLIIFFCSTSKFLSEANF
jgi:hypothetical protein